MRVPKPITLDKLERELRAAGVAVNGLGLSGDDLHTYTATGEYLDVPLAASDVIDKHVADPDVDPDAELEGAILGVSTDGIAKAQSLAEIRAATQAAIEDLKRAMLGMAGRKGRVAGRRA